MMDLGLQATPSAAPVNITHFMGAGMYAEIEPLPVIAEPRLIVEAPTGLSSDAVRYFGGRHSNDRFYLGQRFGGLIVGHGTTYSDLPLRIDDEVRRRYELYMDGSEAVVDVDGVEVFRQGSQFTGDLSDFVIARNPTESNAYHEGPLPLFQINDGDLVVRKYTFGREDGIVENEAPTLLQECELSKGTNTEWELLGDGVWKRTADGTWGRLMAIDTRALGAYRVELRIDPAAVGGLRLYRKSADGLINETVRTFYAGDTFHDDVDVLFDAGGWNLWFDSMDFTGEVYARVSRVVVQGGELGREHSTVQPGGVVPGSNGTATIAAGVKAGTQYLIQLPPGLRLSGPVGWTPSNTTGGAFLHTANEDGAFQVLNTGPEPIALDGVSVRRATGWGQVHNQPADAVRRYVRKDGDLVNAQWPNLLRFSNALDAWSRNRDVIDVAFDQDSGLWRLTKLASTSTQVYLNCPLLLPGETYTLSADVIAGTWSSTFQMAYYDGGRTVSPMWASPPADRSRVEFTFTVPDDEVVNSPQIRLIGWSTGAEIGEYLLLGNIQLEKGDQATRYKSTDGGDSGVKIAASDLFKLRERIDELLANKAGKVRTIPRFDGVGMYGRHAPWSATGPFEVHVFARIRCDMNTQRRRFGSDEVKTCIYGINPAPSPDGRDLFTLAINNEWGSGWTDELLPRNEFLRLVYSRDKNDLIRYYADGRRVAEFGTPRPGDIHIDTINWAVGENDSRWDDYDFYRLYIDLQNPLENSCLLMMDSATGLIYDALAESGPELCDFKNLGDQGTGWFFDGVLKKTGDDTTVYDFDVDLIEGMQYRIRFAKQNHSTGTPSWCIGGTTQTATMPRIQNYDGDGIYEFLFTAAASGSLGLAANLSRLEIPHLSVTAAPNAGQIHNAPDDAYPQFIYQGDHKKEWLSPVLNKNPDFSEGAAHWKINGVPTEYSFIDFEGGKCRVVSDGQYIEASQLDVMEAGELYRHAFKVEHIDGEGQVYTGSNNYTFSEEGRHSFDTTTVNRNVTFKRIGPCDYTVTRFTTRKVLKEAS